MNHDLHSFVRRSQRELQEEYDRIRARATQDPGTAGDQGEENWATLLGEWLPDNFHVVTKGRILTDSGYTSPQVDVVVLYPSYPRILLGKKLYLSGGVAAAFECKLTLTAAHVQEAVKTAAAIKAALSRRTGSPYKELHAGIIYGLLAHSHSWQGTKSTPIENVEKALWDSDEGTVRHPRECIDFVSVSNLATWQVMKTTYLSPLLPFYTDEIQKVYGSHGSAMTAYVRSAITDEQTDDFSPIGVLLSGLYSKLAWHFPDMRPLEEYFRKVNMPGRGQGRMRLWDINIYSEDIRERVYHGQLSNGVPHDEWSVVF